MVECPPGKTTGELPEIDGDMGKSSTEDGQARPGTGDAAGGDEAARDGHRGRPGRGFLLAGAALAGLAIAHGAPGVTAIGPVRQRLFPRLAGIGRSDHVALSFDDGPDPASTPAFLDLLAERAVTATFFLLGSMVAKAPGLAAEIVARGHEVALHGWEHACTLLRTPRAVRDDLARARDTVADATGAEPAFYRPPYGVLSGGALAAARGLALTPVLWSSWGKEWLPGATAESVYRTAAAGLGGGSCVLLHDSDCTSPPGAALAALGALPRLLDDCQAAALDVGPLADHGVW
jgi:peptidoglycan/xylan/chitin deacetylase (PgdA/CDA1 family)